MYSVYQTELDIASCSCDTYEMECKWKCNGVMSVRSMWKVYKDNGM